MALPKSGDVTANGWNEYKRLVLAELERLDKSVSQLVVKYDVDSRCLERSIVTSKDAVIVQVTVVIQKMDERIEKAEQEQTARIDLMEKEVTDRRDADDVRMKKMEDEVFTIKTKAVVWGGVASVLLSILIVLGKELISYLNK